MMALDSDRIPIPVQYALMGGVEAIDSLFLNSPSLLSYPFGIDVACSGCQVLPGEHEFPSIQKQ